MMTNSMKSETFVQGGIWWCPQRNEAVTLWWRSVICGIFSGIGARTCCFFSQRTGSVNKMSPERLKLPELTCIAADDPAATDARIWSCSAPLTALNPLTVDCFSPPDASNVTAGIPDSSLSFMCLPAHTLTALSHSPLGVCVSALRHTCKCVRACCCCLDSGVQMTV